MTSNDDTQLYAGPDDDPDRYCLDPNPLGSGGEGEVYKATISLTRLGKRAHEVAVKVWRDPDGRGSTFEARTRGWRAQLQLVQSVNHPGIVRMREVFIGAPPHVGTKTGGSDRALYLVMDLARGTSLRTWWLTHPDAGIDEIVRILTVAADAVAYLHSGDDTGGHPVIHRDLKPENLIIGDTVDKVLIVDFGLARGIDHTRGLGVGTPGYLAPEAAMGRYTTASDVFSLGAIAYFLLVGARPQIAAGPAGDDADGYDLTAVQARLARSPLGADHPGIVDAICQAMAPDPTDRPADLKAWVEQLRDGAAGDGSSSESPAGLVQMPPPDPPDPTDPTIPSIPDGDADGGGGGGGLPRSARMAAVVACLALVTGAVVFGVKELYPECRPVSLHVTSSTEKDALVAGLAEEYNKQGRQFEGRCAQVSVSGLSSGTAEQALASGWTGVRDPRTGGPVERPEVWLPSSSLWSDRLRLHHPEMVGDETFESLVKSPLTLAMHEPMARALGWPDKPVSWSVLYELARDGWGRYGHPEWGGFKLAKDKPAGSTSGLTATIATTYAAPGGLRDGDNAPVLNDPNTITFMHGIESAVEERSDDAVETMKKLAAEADPLRSVHAFAVQEEMVYLYNTGDADGDPATPPKEPPSHLVAMFPTEGTIMMDHPFVVLADATPDERDAAEDFKQYLLDHQQTFLDAGFRDARGKPDGKLAEMVGLRPGVSVSFLTDLSPTWVDQLLKGWPKLQGRARVLLVLDVSGSMNEPVPGTGKSRIELLRPAVRQGLDLLGKNDEIEVWTMSTESSEGHVVVQPMAKVGTVRDGLAGKMSGLTAGPWDTPLYRVTRDALNTMLAKKLQPDGAEDEMILHAIVLLSDGHDDPAGGANEGEPQRRKELLDVIGQSGAQVPIFTIPYGTTREDADTLKQISATSGVKIDTDATDPSKITEVFTKIFFGL